MNVHARRHLIGEVLVVTIAALAAPPAVAQSQQQIDQCANKGGSFTPDVRITACTSLIQSDRSAKSLAPYYYQRGNAYDDKKDYDRAITDYGEAIGLEPKEFFCLQQPRQGVRR